MTVMVLAVAIAVPSVKGGMMLRESSKYLLKVFIIFILIIACALAIGHVVEKSKQAKKKEEALKEQIRKEEFTASVFLQNKLYCEKHPWLKKATHGCDFKKLTRS